MLALTVHERRWPMREPFAISRGVQLDQPTIVLQLVDEAGRRGRGEACGVPYEGETPGSMIGALEGVRAVIEAGVTREDILELLPAGGARCALDSALWDLEAKRTGRSAASLAGFAELRAVETAITIGIRALPAYEAAGRAASGHALIKIKVDAVAPLDAISAVRRGAPASRFIVDPNQSWSIDQLKALAPQLKDLGVVLLEQPIGVGQETGLDGYRCPVEICADELVRDRTDLTRAAGRFDVINIKLDKTGGLTTALDLADAAQAMGFRLMVGCMAGSSLSMAPAHILAQRCAYVDLDGPLLQAEDWGEHAMVYAGGWLHPPSAALWG
jgi:L-alanine-DL-glutamate epimerase-like enolase superfamily enzyme